MLLEEQRDTFESVDVEMVSAGILVRAPTSERDNGLADHLTTVIDSFFGQICSRIWPSFAARYGYCDNMADRTPRCVDDFMTFWL